MLSVVTVMGSTAACSVVVGGRGPESEQVRAALDRGTARFDLTTPPDRDDVGMLPGNDEVVYQSTGEPLRARIVLPGGRELAVDTDLLLFSVANRPGTDAAPDTLDVHARGLSLESGRRQLLDVAHRFGLDAGPVEEWYAQAKEPLPVAGPGYVASPWQRTRVGHVRLDVRGTYTPGTRNFLHSDHGADVHYLLTWDAGEPPVSVRG